MDKKKARENYIQVKQYLDEKTKNTDFDANNYDIEELAAILNFKYIPLNEGIIKERILIMKNKFKNKQKYLDFFSDVENKLIDNFKLVNKETWEDAYENDDSEASKVLKNQFQKLSEYESKNGLNHIIDKNRGIIGKKKLTPEERFQTNDMEQGDKNPFKRKKVVRYINFDGRFRQILPRNAVACEGSDSNLEKRLYTPTDYIAHLSEPLSNVESIEVDSVEIPKSWFIFSNSYGTTSFKIHSNALTNNETTITIEEGSYSIQRCIQKINTEIQKNSEIMNNIIFSFNEDNNMIDISNNDSINDISFNWYIPEVSGGCSNSGEGAGSKIDYNLGWILGFRTSTTHINKLSRWKDIRPSSHATIDVFGTKYLFITLDDFNNNKPTNVVVAATEPAVTKFRLPSYYNDQTMNEKTGIGKYYPGHNASDIDAEKWACIDVSDTNNDDRGCSTNELNRDLRKNLNKQQLYSIDQILQAQHQSLADRYTPPEPTDLLLKVQIPQNIPFGGQILVDNKNNSKFVRHYFGPVKLSKFRVRLVNDKGYNINLHNRDWSFTLRVTQKYQY